MKKTTGSSTRLITVDGVEGEVTVDYEYTPGDPGRMYMMNGDPGYPPEPAEIEVQALWLVNGDKKIDVLDYLTQEQIEAIQDAIYEEGPEGVPDYDD